MGIQCVIKGTGLADQDDLHEFTEFINNRSKRTYRIIIDFTQIEEIQAKHCIYLKQMLESLVKRRREIAVVHIGHLCEGIPRNPDLKNVHFFDTLDLARTYFFENPIHALVIEDEEITAKRIERFLEARQFHVHTVHTAEDCFSVMGNVLPSIILMDIHLPGMNGVEAAKKLKTSSYGKITPLFILTNERSKEFVVMCSETQVDGYLLKPLTEEGFQTKLLPAVIRYQTHLQNF
jgi:CheY-like chemotaxis protein